MERYYTKVSNEDKLKHAIHWLDRQLYGIMEQKRSLICLSVFLRTVDETLAFIDRVGPHIAVLRTQIRRFGPTDCVTFVNAIKVLKKRHNFLIMEDRGFNDLATSVAAQYKGFYVDYADFITIYPNLTNLLAIRKVIKDSMKSLNGEFRACLVITEVDFHNKPEDYNPQLRLQSALRHSRLTCGIISQDINVHDPNNMIKATPGVHLTKDFDGLNQNYKTPEQVVKSGSDIIIVGRGIVARPKTEWLAATLEYRNAAWNAYLEHLQDGMNNVLRTSFEERWEYTQSPLLKRLFEIIIQKQTTLCIAADFNTFDDLVEYMYTCGQHVCVLKVQIERFGRDNCQANINRLLDLREELNVLIFEDAKLDYPYDDMGDFYKSFYVDHSDFITMMPNDPNFRKFERMISTPGQIPHVDRKICGCLSICELSYDCNLNYRRTEANRYLIASRAQPTTCGILSTEQYVEDQYNMIKVAPYTYPMEELNLHYMVANGDDLVRVDIDYRKGPYSIEDQFNQLLNTRDFSWSVYAAAAGKTLRKPER